MDRRVFEGGGRPARERSCERSMCCLFCFFYSVGLVFVCNSRAGSHGCLLFLLFMLYAFISARSCATAHVSVAVCVESVSLLPKYAVFKFPSCCEGGPTRLRLYTLALLQ